MEFGQIMKYKEENNFLHKSCRKCGRRQIVPNLFLCFKEAVYEVKINTQHLNFFVSPQLERIIKTNGMNFQAVNPEICSILIF